MGLLLWGQDTFEGYTDNEFLTQDYLLSLALLWEILEHIKHTEQDKILSNCRAELP